MIPCHSCVLGADSDLFYTEVKLIPRVVDLRSMYTFALLLPSADPGGSAFFFLKSPHFTWIFVVFFLWSWRDVQVNFNLE